jgi:predicted aminopeptidase
MPNLSKHVSLIITLCFATLLSSCSTISYYKQSVAGQLQLLHARQDIKSLLNSDKTNPELKQRLKSITSIRNFASKTLGLPDNKSYRSYADIGRRYIVWNVFATPALSFEAKSSCFLVVGCLSYRGYFKKEDATRYMNTLKDTGYDVYLGGVTAYSTLGWFDDPVLNGMLEKNDFDLARLLFHELAHQQLYINDDTEFNEAFADAVALIGLDYWISSRELDQHKLKYDAQLERESSFIELVLAYTARLEQLYESAIPDEQKHAGKILLFGELKKDYEKLRDTWGGHPEYDNWMNQGLNNAKLATISTYRTLVPAFLDSYKTAGKDIRRFYSRVKIIGSCEASQRRLLLKAQSNNIACLP